MAILVIILLVVNAYTVSATKSSALSVGFYDQTCPQLEKLIYRALVKKMSEEPTPNSTIPGILKLFYTDCFVEGCDGSILISSDDRDAERYAEVNLSLREDAFQLVDMAKEAAEAECPSVVSCSDILAILARDVVTWWDGPTWQVEKGRRDGLVSSAEEAQRLMPKSYENLTTILGRFEALGFSVVDLVTLTGGHTIGLTHCQEFASRIYDASMSPAVQERITSICNFPNFDRNVTLPLDQDTGYVFDNKFFDSVIQKKGLLLVDHELAYGGDARATVVVERFATDQVLFFRVFANSMIDMGRIGVKTGNQGEIRRYCRKFN